MKQIGILSDTHGVLSREAIAALDGSDMILHAGDVGDPGLLGLLRRLAPVVAVRGNTDWGKWAAHLPVTDMVAVEASFFYLLHDYQHLDIDPASAGIQAVISGHTHKPMIRWEAGVLCFNPGSASQPRYGGPLSIGRIRMTGAVIEPEIVTLS
jgi:putative phosphoesterase